MGRKPKVEVPEEELQALDNNELDAKSLGEKYEQPRSYFDNLKHKRKLKTSFALKTADPNIQNNAPQTENQQAPQLDHQVAPPIDYHMAVKGLYKGADSIFKLVSVMSRGQVEYINCTDQELDDLANITQNDQAIQKIATMGGVSTIVTVGSIMATFGSKFKIVKKIKHNAKDPNCKCKACENLRSLQKEMVSKKEDLDLTTIKRETPEQKEASQTEKLAEKITDGLTKDPAKNSAGMIIEKNIPKNISESDVIKQNSGAKIE